MALYKDPTLSADNSDFRLYELLKNNSRFFRIADASNQAKSGRLRQQSVKCARSGQVVVEDDGIEPTTPCLQSRCSPS